ncbi:MAG: ABC transporter substrate-binding protein [Micrococcales bacterium]|nr:ABC transporter substrate-binding protein [Micrococcales bacterium]
MTSVRNKVLALAAVAALGLTLAACGSGDEPTDTGSPKDTGAATDTEAPPDTDAPPPEPAPAGDGVVLWNGSEPQNPLIPTNTNEVGGGRIVDLLFAGLVYYDAEGNTNLDMAESIESDDSINWTVKLKDGQSFENGDPVDAAAFVGAWNWGSTLANAQLNSSWFEVIKGFEEMQEEGSTIQELEGLAVVDDLTFTIELVDPDPNFVLMLGYSVFYPQSATALSDMEAAGQRPIANGPYKLASDDAWQHNIEIAMVPNESYQGGRQPQNVGVTIKFYAENTASYLDLLAGNLDVLDQIPPDSLATFKDELGERAVSEPGSLFQSFTIPDRLAHFAGEEGKLRRHALSMAINRQEICDVIFSGTRTPASDFTSPLMPGWTGKIEGNDVLQYNADKAKELWEEADAISPWEGTFKIAYNADGPHAQWVEAVLNSIHNTLGIDTEPDPYPTFQDSRTAITDRVIETPFRTGWQADYPSMYNYLAPLYATGAGSNDGDYSNAEFDALLTQGLSQETMDAQADLYNQAQAIIMDDLPAIPLWYQDIIGGVSEHVDNVFWGWDTVPIAYLITKG